MSEAGPSSLRETSVSIIIPVHNAGNFLDDCFNSILNQTYEGKLEISIFNDASTDNSLEIMQKWKPKFESKPISVVISEDKQDSESPPQAGGVGYARNKAVLNSSGKYLCFLDADDMMYPTRISSQLKAALLNGIDCLIGSNFTRDPPDSTARYTSWCNRINGEMLYNHQYREVTLAMPTWFMSRDLFDRVGGFEEKLLCPEDLIFFHKHLDLGGTLFKVGEPLVIYRYHLGQTSFKIHRLELVNVRIKAFQSRVLSTPEWQTFTIWGAGRDGRKFFKMLNDAEKKKVQAFCDVAENKVGTVYQFYNYKIPFLHFSKAHPPFLICVAM
eukprot:TRINITY_DN7115_c0_g1_i1.p1 TRINITY_DN7115_c0_g1~~TRINITY_DN7115_c0_g1_i1.p1  ORF type:complete len:328 (-),score=60.67 TRINITY_DN7115_c0_g1_i1:119-1102(-)